MVALEVAGNRLVVGAEAELLSDRLVAADLAWVSGRPPEPGIEVTARIRYRASDTPVDLTLDDGRASVRFASPRRAVAPGQAVVFYAGDRVLGGGIIQSAESAVNGTPENRV